MLLSLQELLNTPIALPTKEKEPAHESPSSVTVFTEADIRALGVRTLNELLNLAVGLDVRRYREPSEIIAVRGVGSEFNERILTMVDGVRVNDVYTGGTTRTVRAINLDNVERVEVVRGPGSALYGTSAFAGPSTWSPRTARPTRGSGCAPATPASMSGWRR
ncbi:MAG: TonB-dependent receptor [Myxococcaceae bacterium]